jgi:hypothetical protein
MEPVKGLEPIASSLQNWRSTIELHRLDFQSSVFAVGFDITQSHFRFASIVGADTRGDEWFWRSLNHRAMASR